MADIYNGFLGLIKYWDTFDYLCDCVLVTKCMAGQGHGTATYRCYDTRCCIIKF